MIGAAPLTQVFITPILGKLVSISPCLAYAITWNWETIQTISRRPKFHINYLQCYRIVTIVTPLLVQVDSLAPICPHVHNGLREQPNLFTYGAIINSNDDEVYS